MTEALLTALQKRFPAHAESLPALLPALEAGEPTLFVLRYGRDLLGDLDDGAFRKVRAGHREERDILKRRAATLRALEEAEKLDADVTQRVEQTRDLVLLEDLIRPVREARRAGKKNEDPMTPVAQAILAATPEEPGPPIEEQLAPFCGKDGAHPTVEDQTQRLRRLLADEIGADAFKRQAVRNAMRRMGKLVTTAPEGKEPKKQYAAVVGLSEPLNRVKPRTLLLVRRGQKAGALHAHVEIPAEDLQELFETSLAVPAEHPHADLVRAATLDAMERVLLPAGSIELINERKRVAERAMIPAFADTLRDRAMVAPAGAVPIVAVAPGATGAARVLAVDAEGRPGRHEAIHPLPPRNEGEEAARLLREIVAETGAKLVAAPASGRASSLRDWVVQALDGAQELGAHAVPVHEAAAAHHSNSDAAKSEQPDLPSSARTALSLGRYVQDPLSEIAGYDLTRLVLGPNQRDVDQGELRHTLDETFEECVGIVGVDVNRASVALLARVPGLGEAAAKEMVAKREAEGPFTALADLKALESVDEETWQRAGGFLRIDGAADPFDTTAAHPTGLPIARAICERVGKEIADLLVDPSPLQPLNPDELASEAHTAADVESVLRALSRGLRDPRGPFLPPVSNPGLRRLRDVKEEMVLEGVVASLAKFGAFVDVGLRQQGLVHVSELSHTFLETPADAVSVGDRVRVKVLKVDVPKRRLSLSIKALVPPPPASARGGPDRGRGRGRGRQGGGGRRGSASTRHEIPREKDPFHLQLNALRAQLGFEEEEPKQAPAKKPRKATEKERKKKAKSAAKAERAETTDKAKKAEEPKKAEKAEKAEKAAIATAQAEAEVPAATSEPEQVAASETSDAGDAAAPGAESSAADAVAPDSTEEGAADHPDPAPEPGPEGQSPAPVAAPAPEAESSDVGASTSSGEVSADAASTDSDDTPAADSAPPTDQAEPKPEA